jgi:hypothetical protein
VFLADAARDLVRAALGSSQRISHTCGRTRASARGRRSPRDRLRQYCPLILIG